MGVAGATPTVCSPASTPMARSCSRYAGPEGASAATTFGFLGSGLANGTVPKRRHQTGLSEQPNFSKLLQVENDGPRRHFFAQNAHHAIAASIAVAHDAGVTRDHENWLTNG